MPTPIFNRFASFKFESEAEEKAAHSLHTLNLMWLQNLRSEAANDRLNLEYDPDKPNKFLQDEAAIKGQIKILDFILDTAVGNKPENGESSVVKSS